eukprot:173531-Rhodomonas_salina.2
MALCTGERGKGRHTRAPLHYKGCPFHRIIPGTSLPPPDKFEEKISPLSCKHLHRRSDSPRPRKGTNKKKRKPRTSESRGGSGGRTLDILMTVKRGQGSWRRAVTSAGGTGWEESRSTARSSMTSPKVGVEHCCCCWLHATKMNEDGGNEAGEEECRLYGYFSTSESWGGRGRRPCR